MRSTLTIGLAIAALLELAPAWGSPGSNAPGRSSIAGAVYTMTNGAAGNEVLVYRRQKSGELTYDRAVPTGGLGTGGGLGNQGALALSASGRHLYAVNAGSDQVSVFRIDRGLPVLQALVPSGGRAPISLTLHGHLLYVLHAGGSYGSQDRLVGFAIRHGALTPIADLPLSAAATGPAQVSFTSEGNTLVVTEKATNRIDTYVVDDDGVASGPSTYPSAGATPFGFGISEDDTLIVSEAAGGAPDGSSLSSYGVSEDGVLQVVTGVLPTTETAACWVAVHPDGEFAYTTNAGSSSISGVRIGSGGAISLLDPDGRTAQTPRGPTDLAFSRGGRFLYALAPSGETIRGYAVRGDGSLVMVGDVPVRRGSNGLVAQ